MNVSQLRKQWAYEDCLDTDYCHPGERIRNWKPEKNCAKKWQLSKGQKKWVIYLPSSIRFFHPVSIVSFYRVLLCGVVFWPRGELTVLFFRSLLVQFIFPPPISMFIRKTWLKINDTTVSSYGEWMIVYWLLVFIAIFS